MILRGIHDRGTALDEDSSNPRPEPPESDSKGMLVACSIGARLE